MDSLTEAASKAAIAGKATDEQLRFLRAKTGLENTELRARKLKATIEDLGSSANILELPKIDPADKPGGGGGGGGLGGDSAFLDILKDLDAEANALDARTAVVGKSIAAEAEFLAMTRARNKAREEGIALGKDEIETLEIFTSDIGDATARLEKAQTLKSITGNLEDEAAFLKNRITLIGKNTKEAAEFVAITEAMNEAVRAGVELSDEEIKNIKERAAAIGEAAEELRVKFEEDNAIQGITDDITGPFKDALTEGKLSFKSFAKALLDTGRRLLARMIDEVFKPLEDALIKALSGAQSGGSGGGGTFGTLVKAFAGAFGGAAGGATTGAAGTSVTGTSTIPSFDRGGSFKVGGKPGTDSNVIAFNATRGERVDITPAGKSSPGGSGPISAAVMESLSAGASNKNDQFVIDTSDIPSFTRGGSFTVGGSPGVENNIVSFRNSRSERGASDSAGKSSDVGVVVQVINNTPVKTREEQSTGSNGEQIRRFIIDEVGKATALGEFDKQQQARFGAAPVRMKR